MTAEEVKNVVEKYLGKTGKRILNPDRTYTFFLATLVHGYIWVGDIDLKKDEKQISGITNEIEETVYVLKINTVRSLGKDLNRLTPEDIEKYCIGKSYVQSKIDL